MGTRDAKRRKERGVGRTRERERVEHLLVNTSEDRERVCGCVPTRHLNYPRLVLKLPPLLLWAATVIGLYRAICWLPR